MKLLKYIQGHRKGKEAHRLEKEAMRDPFLADALEGFDSVKADHIQSIEHLRRQIDNKSNSNRRRNLLWTYGIAASLLVGVFITTHYLLKTDLILDEKFALEQQSSFEQEEEMPIVIKDPKEDIISQNKETVKESSPGKVVPVTPPTFPVAPIPEILTIVDDEDIVEIDHLERPFEDAYEIIIAEEEVIEPITIKEITCEEEVTVEEDIIQEKLAQAQPKGTKRVRGKVVDREGEPLIGVSIYVPGTQVGTMTNMDGDFELVVDPNAQLSVNYIGFESLSLPADTSGEMYIAMNEDTRTLDEVVVVGYGRSAKKVSKSDRENAVDKEPKPIIGKKEYEKYLTDNLRMPTDSDCGKGKVKLSFNVDSNGRPYQIYVEKGLCNEADTEAIRLVQEGPDWTVGSKRVTLEIKF